MTESEALAAFDAHFELCKSCEVNTEGMRGPFCPDGARLLFDLLEADDDPVMN